MAIKIVLLLALCATAAMAAPAAPSIVEIAESTPALSTLVAALKAGGLVDTLSGAGPFTVFAPTNDAFNALPAGVLDNLLKPENKDVLDAVLTYHVVAARALSSDLVNGESIQTVNGNNVTVGINTNVYVNLAQVTQANILASNGVVHVVNTVILPPSNETIVQTAVGAPNLKTLVTAVQAAGLVPTLSAPGALTVLAPTDDAFAKLPSGVIQHLLEPANKGQLIDLLTYHVIAGNVFSVDLVNNAQVTTVEGKQVTVTVDQNGVSFNGNSKVVAANIFTSNGVVHEIDTVLMPPSLEKEFEFLAIEARIHEFMSRFAHRRN